MSKVIYFIRKGDTPYYKIGIAKDPESRLKQLQTGSEAPLQIVGLFTHDNSTINKAEKNLHNYLKATIPGKQKSMHGEWFQMSDGWLHTIFFEMTTKLGYIEMNKKDTPKKVAGKIVKFKPTDVYSIAPYNVGRAWEIRRKYVSLDPTKDDKWVAVFWPANLEHAIRRLWEMTLAQEIGDAVDTTPEQLVKKINNAVDSFVLKAQGEMFTIDPS